MRTLLLLPAFLLGTIGFANPCEHVKGTGDVVKKTIAVQAFHGIDVEGSIDVVLTQATTQSVEIEAQANLIDLVKTEVKDGIWTISTGDKGYSTDKAFTVHISVPSIDVVSIQGSGDVKGVGNFSADNVVLDIEGSGDMSLAFTTKSIKAVIQGSGDMKLSGTSATLKAHVEGSGDISAKDLVCANADVSSEGSGDITVNVSESLAASIAGSGDVTYKGHPAKVNKNVDGSGEVRSMESLAR